MCVHEVPTCEIYICWYLSFLFCFSGGVPYMTKAFGDMTVAFWGYLVPLSQVVQPAGISQYLLTQEHKSLMGAADCTRSDVWEASLDKTSWCTCPDRCSVFLFTYFPDELHFSPWLSTCEELSSLDKVNYLWMIRRVVYSGMHLYTITICRVVYLGMLISWVTSILYPTKTW